MAQDTACGEDGGQRPAAPVVEGVGECDHAGVRPEEPASGHPCADRVAVHPARDVTRARDAGGAEEGAEIVCHECTVRARTAAEGCAPASVDEGGGALCGAGGF